MSRSRKKHVHIPNDNQDMDQKLIVSQCWKYPCEQTSCSLSSVRFVVGRWPRQVGRWGKYRKYRLIHRAKNWTWRGVPKNGVYPQHGQLKNRDDDEPAGFLGTPLLFRQIDVVQGHQVKPKISRFDSPIAWTTCSLYEIPIFHPKVGLSPNTEPQLAFSWKHVSNWPQKITTIPTRLWLRSQSSRSAALAVLPSALHWA